jgi:hypothetical protein
MQGYISLNNGLDIRWNKYLKKKAVIVSLPTWLGTQKPTYLNKKVFGNGVSADVQCVC